MEMNLEKLLPLEAVKQYLRVITPDHDDILRGVRGAAFETAEEYIGSEFFTSHDKLPETIKHGVLQHISMLYDTVTSCDAMTVVLDHYYHPYMKVRI